jgi:hypothetical protein
MSQGQAQAEDTTSSSLSSESLPADKEGTYYKLSTATATNDGSALIIGDSDSKIFTTEATLSKWNGEASLVVSLPPAIDKSFTWNTAVKIAASVDRIDGKLVVTPEKIVYPYDDNTDLLLYELPPDAQNEGGSFEYELKLYGIPKSNVFTFNIETENLVFYYQPSLTLKEIEQGDIQPENVAGSYAVYHASKKNNEYKTGKAFHIYRPKVVDARGAYVWGDLNIDTKAGVMTITVDQKFLDNAIYPIVVDPTFGKTVKGGTASTLRATDYIDGVIYTGSTGAALSVTVYVTQYQSRTPTMAFGLYTNAGNKVGVTGAWTQTASYDDWKTLTFASPPAITAQSYNIVANANDSYVYAYDTGSSGDEKYVAGTYGTWATPVSWTSSTRVRSHYCTYTAPPTMQTDAADDITYSTATLNGQMTANGGENADYYKFEWDTDSGAPYANSWTSDVGNYGVAAYDHAIDSLDCGDTIYFRIGAHNAGGWGYGSELDFNATSCTEPEVTTDATDDIAAVTATLNGSITDNGGEDADYYRFEWDTDSGAPYANYYQSGAGSYGVGSYDRAISSLSAGTEYYARFGAHNVSGTGWGNETKFLTLPVKPSLLVDGAKTSESIAYTWTKGNGAQKTMIRYSDSAYPTNRTEGTQGYYDTGTSTTITGLDPSTYYYFSAWSYVTTDGLEQWSADYATDTAYTRPDDVLTFTATNFTVNTADLDWVIPEGADYVRIRSKVDSAPTSPSDGTHVYYGTGTDTTAAGLSPNSHYYFAIWGYYTTSTLYSENSASDDDWTLIDTPIITNDIGASGVGKTSATLNGAVTYTGGENPDCYFYWGDNDAGFDRFSWDNEEIMGEQSGTFSIPLGSLTEGITYYYVTYGENSAGSDWAASVEQFTCGCLAVEDFEVTQINDYQFDFTWTPKATITTIRMGIDSPPSNAFDGTLVYRGNGTATSWYADTQCTSGNMTFRAWSDCTACLTCTTPAFSDTYLEDSVVLSGNCSGGAGDMTKAVYDTNDDGIVDEADYASLAGNSTYSVTSGNATYATTAGDADTLDTHHWNEIPGSGGDMYKSVYDTNDDGVVDAADYAALSGDADTLDGHHWIEIPGGGGNVTFVTDAGNVTGTLFYLLGSGTISTSGDGNNTIIINGTTFLSLPDTPDSYTGQAGKYVAVNVGETAVEFVEAPTGPGGGNVTSAFSYISLPNGDILSATGEDTLYLDGTDIIFENGTGNTIEASIGGENVDTIASNSTLALLLAIPLLLGLLGVSRHSLAFYLAGIGGFGISLSYIHNDTLGTYLTFPIAILIVGLIFGAVLDAWNERMVII